MATKSFSCPSPSGQQAMSGGTRHSPPVPIDAPTRPVQQCDPNSLSAPVFSVTSCLFPQENSEPDERNDDNEEVNEDALNVAPISSPSLNTMTLVEQLCHKNKNMEAGGTNIKHCT